MVRVGEGEVGSRAVPQMEKNVVRGARERARTGWSAVAMRLLNLSILSVPASFLAM